MLKQLKFRKNKLKKINVICILKKKKNNFFATILDKNFNTIFNKSCGSLANIRGSKKYTTVAVETLGKEVFLRIYALGYRRIKASLFLRLKVDKFVRSFVRGFCIFSKKYMRMTVDLQLNSSHNGLRAASKRRV